MLENTPTTTEVQVDRRENRERECTTVTHPSPAAADNNTTYNNNNRWSKEETLALLKVRSDLDFPSRKTYTRTQSPLWHEVSRKMAELGYNRSADKCKEKFENIYKYNKRLQRCPDAKSISRKKYPFSNQLEAIDCHETSFKTSDPQQVIKANKDSIVAVNMQKRNAPNVPQLTMPVPVHFDLCPTTTTTSMSTTSPSESESEGARKRNWEDYFWGLMDSVLEKQEELQKKFLEAVDRREHERLAREEAWKMQEMARIKREHDQLMHERSISMAKDAAVLAFLQRVSEKCKCPGASLEVVEPLGQNTRVAPLTPTTGTAPATTQSTLKLTPSPTTLAAPVTTLTSVASPTTASGSSPMQTESIICKTEKVTGGYIYRRWPKEEVEALIRVKSEMDLENKELKPLSWDDVSMRMRRIGYDRSARRCKEKWDNMKKYYRKMKDINKRMPLDYKTCHYFHLLDELNIDKKLDNNSSDSSGSNLRPEKFLMDCVNQQSELLAAVETGDGTARAGFKQEREWSSR